MLKASIQKKQNVRLLFFCSLVAGLLLCSNIFSQVVQPPRPIRIPPRPIALQSVVIYENANFTGRAKSLGVGEHRLFQQTVNTRVGDPANFDNIVSSIKVPPGFVAILFEEAEELSGYGAWVDLLEDRADLSALGFDNKSSYIKVFRTSDSRGFIWVRSATKNGRFVAGHWERKRADGENPNSSEAVVAPPLPPHSQSRPTVIQVAGAQSMITSLGTQNSSDAALWEVTEAEGMGVIGSDYRGQEEIGSAPFERAGSYVPNRFNFWYPQRPPQEPRDHRNPFYKRTLSGIVDAGEKPYIVNEDVPYLDDDVVFNVTPLPKYRYLVTDAHKPEMGKLEIMKIIWRDREIPYNQCREPFKFVHSEIDVKESGKIKLLALLKGREGKQVSAYGPWIYDYGHCHHPEIHPAEQIWWSSTIDSVRAYNLNIFADSSKRFLWRNQMDSDDGKLTELKPWGAPPITGIYALSFEVELKPGKYFGKKFEVRSLDQWNVASHSNGIKTYNLAYQGNDLISFIPNSDLFKVSFERVGLKPGTNNIVRGFLVIETSVGKVTQIATKVDGVTIPQGTDPNDARKVPQDVEERAFKKEHGHYIFTVLRTDMR